MRRILSNAPGNYELRIDLEDWDGETRYAQYSIFDIGGPEDNYKLAVYGYTGNAGDISEKSGTEVVNRGSYMSAQFY